MFSSTHRKTQLSSINRRVNGFSLGGKHVQGKYEKLAKEVEYKPPPSPVGFLNNLLHPPPPSPQEIYIINNNTNNFVNTLSPADRDLYYEMQMIFASSPNVIEAGMKIMLDPRFASLNQRMQNQVNGVSAKEFKQMQQVARELPDAREITNQLEYAQQRFNAEITGWNNGTSEAYNNFQQAQQRIFVQQQSYQPFLSAYFALRNELAIVQEEIERRGTSSLSKDMRDRIKILVEHDEEVKKLWRNLYDRLHPPNPDSR